MQSINELILKASTKTGAKPCYVCGSQSVGVINFVKQSKDEVSSDELTIIIISLCRQCIDSDDILKAIAKKVFMTSNHEVTVSLN